MRKHFIINIIWPLAATLLLAACEKEPVIGSESADDVRIEAVGVNLEPATKVTLETSTFAWEDGDAIAVWAGTADNEGAYQSCTVASGVISVTLAGSEVRRNYAVYPASVKDDSNYGQDVLRVNLPSSYTLASVSGTKTPLPMVAVNTDGEDLTFYNLCGLLRLTVNQIPSDATALTLDFLGNKVNGYFNVTNPGTTAPYITTTSSAYNDKITITDLGGVTSATINVPLPIGNYTDISITPVGSSTKVAAVRHIHRTAGVYTAQRAHGKALTAALVSFRIAFDTYAIFAPGNLRATQNGSLSDYMASAKSWSFAPTQYGMVTPEDGMMSFDNNDVIDLFGWQGNDASKLATHYGLCVQTDDAYYGNAGGALRADWGANVIGSYPANTWRTPTGGCGQELDYLIYGRINSWGCATVAGVPGFILLPDVFTDPNTNGGSGAFVENETSYSTNVYTAGANWNAMEDAGVVFLPAAGYRSGTSVTQTGYSGHYWSATPFELNKVYSLDIRNAMPSSSSESSRKYGFSVRLIKTL